MTASQSPADDKTEHCHDTTYELTGPRPDDEPLPVIGVERDDWEPGQPCPECGATHLHETHLDGEVAVHTDGSAAFSAALDRLGTVEHRCPACETLLYRHAAFACWLALTNWPSDA